VKPQRAANTVDERDIQGLVRFGYRRMTEATYLLLRIRDAPAARAWCATAPLTTAGVLSRPPPTALQVAFTANGLRLLGVAEEVIARFSAQLVSGVAGEESRSRRLGDVGASAPAHWLWGGPGKVPDLVVMFFAEPGKLGAWMQKVKGKSWNAAFETMTHLSTSDLGGKEPFGFVDGVSQPALDWARQRKPPAQQDGYDNTVALGEFLLGYPNEYGKYTDRPLLDPAEKSSKVLLPAEDAPEKRDLGRNGTYLVLRHLKQDVRGFWKFLDGVARSDGHQRVVLAESMVGRGIDGEALVPLSPEPVPGVAADDDKNRFTFATDPTGLRCPLGAHIRRTNPRNAVPQPITGLVSSWLTTLGFGEKSIQEDLIASARFHRILRRSRESGPPLSPAGALEPTPAGDRARGLHFVCLNANIARQFEFVQNAWAMNPKFNGLSGENDPLLGNRAALGLGPEGSGFSEPRQDAPSSSVTGLPQFITVLGGAYFFLPGIRAMRYFARSASHGRT